MVAKKLVFCLLNFGRVQFRLQRGIVLLLRRIGGSAATILRHLCVLLQLLALGGSIREDLVVNELIVFVVCNLVLCFLDNVHCGQNIEGIVYPTLHILEVDLLAESFVKLKDLVSDLSAGSVRVGSYSGENRSAEEHKFLVFHFDPGGMRINL